MERFSVIAINYTRDAPYNMSSMIINGKRYALIPTSDPYQYVMKVEIQERYYVKTHIYQLSNRDVQIITGDHIEYMCEATDTSLFIRWVWWAEEGNYAVISSNQASFRADVKTSFAYFSRRYESVFIGLYATMPFVQDFLPACHETCAVCMNYPYMPSITNCDHVFCTACITQWLAQKKECPICRSKLPNGQ